MTHAEITRAGSMDLRHRLRIVDYSTIPALADEAFQIRIELARRDADRVRKALARLTRCCR